MNRDEYIIAITDCLKKIENNDEIDNSDIANHVLANFLDDEKGDIDIAWYDDFELDGLRAVLQPNSMLVKVDIDRLSDNDLHEMLKQLREITDKCGV